MTIMRSLIIAAHPDDEILGCGGTALRRIAEGEEFFALVLGEGITARYTDPKSAPPSELKKLDKNFRQVATHMGFKQAWHESFPDNRLDSVDLLDVVKKVSSVISEVKPDTIYTHFEGDLNVDHRICFQAVLTACRPVENSSVQEILVFETPSSTEWISQTSCPQFCPNVFIDIDETLEKKIAAMELYESEARAYPHPRSPEALRIVAKRWGVQVGLKAAEAFMLIRKVTS